MTSGRSIDELPYVVLPNDTPLRYGTLLAALYEQHGPIFRARVPEGGDVVFLVGPEANRFVLASNREAFSHHIGWGQMFNVVTMFGDGLLTMDGAEHDAHRRMMNPAFTIAYMDRYLPIMQRVIRERTARWPTLDSVNLLAEARTITFDVAAEALAGLSAGAEVEQFRAIYFNILDLGDGLDQATYNARLAQLNGELAALLLPKIEARRVAPTDDVLGLLVQARDGAGRALSDEQLIAHTNILLVAGHETSTSLAAWLLYLLAQDSSYTARVLAEQAALLPDDADPTLDAIKRMKVLDNALSEAERLYPPVANGPRGVVQDFEFNGVHVPAGSHVFYSIVGAHLLPSIWSDPLTFDPERFAPPREEHKRVPYSLVGFGGGPRICIGINFAQVEIKALAAHVLRHFELELLPDQPIAQAYFGPTGGPINGIRMRVRERVTA